MTTITVFVSGVVCGLLCSVFLRGALRGVHARFLYGRDSRLLNISDVEREIREGGRIVIVSDNLVFNGFLLRSGEAGLNDLNADGYLINNVRLSKAFLSKRFPSANIKEVRLVHFE